MVLTDVLGLVLVTERMLPVIPVTLPMTPGARWFCVEVAAVLAGVVATVSAFASAATPNPAPTIATAASAKTGFEMFESLFFIINLCVFYFYNE
jgi:hypothetical protein